MANLRSLDSQFYPFADDFVRSVAQAGYQPRVTSTLRTQAQQARLYRRAQLGLSQFPAAPPGTSAHEFGFAFDLLVSPMEALDDLGRFWEEDFGGIWGGHFHDPIHFEAPGWKKLAQLTQERPIAISEDIAYQTMLLFLPGWTWLIDMVPGFKRALLDTLAEHPLIRNYPPAVAIGILTKLVRSWVS